MGVKVRFRRGAWWVIVDHNRMRKAKRIGSKAAAELIAAKIQVARIANAAGCQRWR